MSVKTAAAKRAAQILNAIGATYEIKLADGTKLSNAPKKPARHKFVHTGYAEKVAGMKVGEIQQFPINGFSGSMVERFRGSIAAKGVSSFGKGSCVTSIDKKNGVVEILRAT